MKRIIMSESGKINYDWHLPSEEVLHAMYQNKKQIGGFAADIYWSSSEYDSASAWGQYFYSGYQNYYLKDDLLRVRAVRALPKSHNEIENVFKFKNQDYQAYSKDAPKSMSWYDAMDWCDRLN